MFRRGLIGNADRTSHILHSRPDHGKTNPKMAVFSLIVPFENMRKFFLRNTWAVIFDPDYRLLFFQGKAYFHPAFCVPQAV